MIAIVGNIEVGVVGFVFQSDLEDGSKLRNRPRLASSFLASSENLQLIPSTSMSITSVQARLNPLFDSLKQTQLLISRLSKLPSIPGSSPNNPDEGDARVELSNEIHQSLKEQEEDFELVRQEAEDLTNSSHWARRRDSSKDTNREKERNDLLSQLAKLGEDLKM